MQHIKSVKLVHYPEIKEGTMEDGLPVAPRPELYYFSIVNDEMDQEGQEILVPAVKGNRHYQEVAEWYKKKKIKPFKFKFE